MRWQKDWQDVQTITNSSLNIKKKAFSHWADGKNLMNKPFFPPLQTASDIVDKRVHFLSQVPAFN